LNGLYILLRSIEFLHYRHVRCDKKSKREINYIISGKEKEKRIIAKFDKQEEKRKKVKKKRTKKDERIDSLPSNMFLIT
jgi:negative regulator of sigma E activity